MLIERTTAVAINETVSVPQNLRDITSTGHTQTLSAGQKLYLPFKRLFDIVLSIIALIFCAPIFLIVAIGIKLDSPGPVFYHHKRIGKDGKLFNLHKFRTMVDGSDNWKERLSPEEQEEFQREFKLKNDPRVTRLGNFLRSSSIDELPQIINILKGELSVVGPRPVVEEELIKYKDAMDAFLSIRPGLTGYWQVNGRNGISYERRIELQLHYINKFSPLMDLIIIIKTFPVVLRKSGI